MAANSTTRWAWGAIGLVELGLALVKLVPDISRSSASEFKHKCIGGFPVIQTPSSGLRDRHEPLGAAAVRT